MKRITTWPLASLAAAPLFLLTVGCHNSGGGSDVRARTPATAELVLTDDGLGDLIAFETDVAGIELLRADGDVHYAVVKSVRVDFADLENVGELISRVQLTPARYTGMKLTLDMSEAAALLDGQTEPATIVDDSGNELTGTMDVFVRFPGGGSDLAPASRHLFQMDLDLSQSIESDVANNRVVFRPVIGAEFNPAAPKPGILRGSLMSVDRSTSQFIVERRARDGSSLAEFTIATTNETLFQVNGETFLGDFGLQALEDLSTPRIWVRGAFDLTIPGIRATAVEAGLGVPGGGQDEVLGWIVGRSGGAGEDAELTVLGRSRKLDSGTRRYNTRFSVKVAFGGTKVLRRGTADGLSTDWLQIGQRIWAFGDLDETSLDAGVVADGVVRTVPTTLLGRTGNSATDDTMILELRRIGRVAIDEFDFKIGDDPESDPDAYSVDISALSDVDVASGSKVEVTGWANRVGVVRDTDFEAARVVDREATRSLMVVIFPLRGGGSLTTTASSLQLELDGSRIARVNDGFGGAQLNDSVTVVPRTTRGAWRVVRQGSVAVFRDFGLFANELQNAVNDGAEVFAAHALGSYDESTQTLTAVSGAVRLRN